MNAIAKSTAYVALGSNLPSRAGDPSATLCAAMEVLDGGCGHVVARSSLYRTMPVGNHDQPAFVNAVVALETRLEPEVLLERLLRIEQRFGRDRSQGGQNGPRTLDLDLLLYGSDVLTGPTLTLPHPALAQRRFVLAPLAEIAPELPHLTLHRTMADLLAALPDEGENSITCVHRLPSLSLVAEAAH